MTSEEEEAEEASEAAVVAIVEAGVEDLSRVLQES